MYALSSAEDDVKQLCNFTDFFAYYRFVDPLTNDVYDKKGEMMLPAGQKCFTVWNSDHPCRNCSTFNAYNQNKRMIKLEYFEQQVFLVVSTPYYHQGRAFVVELIANVTESLIINDKAYKNNRDVMSIVNQLNELTVKDSYTGLFNKTYAEQQILNLLNADNHHGPFCAAFMDIDDFKTVNDTYGHKAGDEVILTLAGMLEEFAKREHGWASRFGGDEFLLVLPQADYDHAKKVYRLLSDQISHFQFHKNKCFFSISVSIGFKQGIPGQDQPARFMEQLDENMYRDKQHHTM